MSHSTPQFHRLALLAAALAPIALLTGCANMATTDHGIPVGPSAVLSGSLHGGNQPITNATVILYEAGTSGYGSAGTAVAQTSSANDASASFSFTQNPVDSGNPTGIINAGQNVYSCPTTGNPQMYIIAKGGNTTPTGTNSNAAFIAAIGDCQHAAAQFVDMNEVTTVATLAALQQYFNPNTESFGYNGTAQSAIGFANGLATISVLANMQNGTANASVTPTSAVAGVTATATPEQAKINTFANILAACVNSNSNILTTSTTCQTLFANAVPPASAAQTSQPSLSYATVDDTLKAAYFMLVNPTNSQDPTGKTANLFALAGGVGAPFQPSLSAQPLDWTIGITYSFAGNCTNANGAAFLGSAESIAVDAGGNVWFNNGLAAADALGEISATGAPTTCAFGTIATGRGLTIDPVGNVWTTGSGTNGVYEYLVNGTTLNWATTGNANGIASDGNGNIFYAPSGSATPFQEYVAGSTATAIAPGVAVGTNVTSSTGLLYLAADPAGRLWAASTSGAVLYELYPGGASPVGGYTLADVGTAVGGSVLANDYGTAIDASGNIIGGNTCCNAGAPPANTPWKLVPGATAGTATGSLGTTFVGGLVAPRSSAVDGAGNVWFGMGYPVINAVTGPPATPAVFALAEANNALTTGISPNGSTPATCASTPNCQTKGGFQKAGIGTVRSLAIDPTGNVWAASQVSTASGNSNIVEIVGQAVPVVTPLSIGAKNNTLGTKP